MSILHLRNLENVMKVRESISQNIRNEITKMRILV